MIISENIVFEAQFKGFHVAEFSLIWLVERCAIKLFILIHY